jgi:hypothetical protein
MNINICNQSWRLIPEVYLSTLIFHYMNSS